MSRELIVEIEADADALAGKVADWLVARIAATRGPFALCLSGGSTPGPVYALLASPLYRERVPWRRLHLFWGDERYVPHDHPDSNYRMTRERMIAQVPIPPAQVHPIPVAPSPAEAAAAYERVLRDFYGSDVLVAGRPLFHATLLGLGTDGHVASLFPGTPALDVDRAWVVPVVGVKAEPRISLTFPAIGASAAVAFLVTGADKYPAVERLRRGDPGLPAGRVRAVDELRLFLDEAAAGGGER
jgi:6-phosphogluconolactonase